MKLHMFDFFSLKKGGGLWTGWVKFDMFPVYLGATLWIAKFAMQTLWTVQVNGFGNVLRGQMCRMRKVEMDFLEVWTAAVFVFQCIFVFPSVFQCVFVFESVECAKCRQCNGFSGGVDSRGAWEMDDEHENFPRCKEWHNFLYLSFQCILVCICISICIYNIGGGRYQFF